MIAVDVTLVILFILAALYSGGMTAIAQLRARGPRTAARTGAVTAVVVAASLFLMVLLAHVTVPLAVVGAGVFSAAATYWTLAADLGRARATATAIGMGILIALCFLGVAHLAVLALIGAAGVYQVIRLFLRTRPALLVMGGTFGGLLAASVAVFVVALATM